MKSKPGNIWVSRSQEITGHVWNTNDAAATSIRDGAESGGFSPAEAQERADSFPRKVPKDLFFLASETHLSLLNLNFVWQGSERVCLPEREGSLKTRSRVCGLSQREARPSCFSGLTFILMNQCLGGLAQLQAPDPRLAQPAAPCGSGSFSDGEPPCFDLWGPSSRWWI